MSAAGSTLIPKEADAEAEPKPKRMPYQLGKLLPGKLNVSKYPQVISIFGVEHFNLVTCYGKSAVTRAEADADADAEAQVGGAVTAAAAEARAAASAERKAKAAAGRAAAAERIEKASAERKEKREAGRAKAAPATEAEATAAEAEATATEAEAATEATATEAPEATPTEATAATAATPTATEATATEATATEATEATEATAATAATEATAKAATEATSTEATSTEATSTAATATPTATAATATPTATAATATPTATEAAQAETGVSSQNICVEDTHYENSNIEEASKYFGKNNSVEQQAIESYIYKTRKEFDKLYLNGLKKDEKKLMIKLFRYIFNKEPVSALDESSEYIFSTLPPFFKMPCKNGEGEGKGEGKGKGKGEGEGKGEGKGKGEGEGEGKGEEVNTNLQQRIWSLFKECIKYRIYGSEEVDAQKTMGLNNEIGSLQKLLPRGNQEYKNKQYLRAQLLRMLELLEDNERTCMIFSNKGIEVSLSKYHSAILDLIRRTVKNLVQQKVPITEEEKSKHLALILDEIKNLKEYKDQDSEQVYEDMINVVSGLFNKLTGIDKKLGDLSNEFAKVKSLNQKQQPVQKGGSAKGDSDTDSEADAEEEYERVYTTAMEHLEGIKSKETRSTLLDSVCEILGGTDLDSSIEHAVNKKGFSLSSTLARLNSIDIPESQHTKSFIRCIQTLLEIKEHQIESFVPPSMRAGEHRYEYTMKKYPSLMKYIPKDLFTMTKTKFNADIKKIEKTLRRVYPYSDTLLEDIYIIRDTVDPCCLFYKALLVKLPNLRNRCKKIVNSIPRCKEMLEEILETLQGISGDVSASRSPGITFKEITLPKGFPLLAEAIRSNLPPMKDISLPITIVEHAGEYEEVLGDKPFVLIGEDKTTTFLHGIRDLEIDVTREIDDIRKGEISIGAIMFIYLYIKCDDHIDG